MKRVLAVLAITTVFAVGCSGDDDSDEAAPPPAATCANSAFSDPALASAMESAPLPAGAQLDGGQMVKNSDDPAMQDVVVRICAGDLGGDALKDAARLIADALDTGPLSESIASLRVTNTQGDSELGKVRCEDFQAHYFGPKADAGAARVAWKHPSE